MGIKYYLDSVPRHDGRCYIHREGCPFYPPRGKRIYLGKFPAAAGAELESKRYYKEAVFCRFCLKEPHERRMKRLNPELTRKVNFISSFKIKSARDSLWISGLN